MREQQSGTKRTLLILGALFAIVLALGGALVAMHWNEVKAHQLIQHGNKAYGEGKYAVAIKDYEDALAIAPKTEIGWYNLGLAHLALFSAGSKSPENLAHAQGAIDAFKKYLELDAKDETALGFLIQTYIDSGHYQEALAHFEAELAKNPNDMKALVFLARINTDARQYEEAIKWHKIRAERETNPAEKYDAFYRIGELEFRRLNKHLEVAGEERVKIADIGLAALTHALEAKPDDHNAMVEMNVLFRQRAMGQGLSYAYLVDIASSDLGRQKVQKIKDAQKAAAGNGATPAPAPTAPAPPK